MKECDKEADLRSRPENRMAGTEYQLRSLWPAFAVPKKRDVVIAIEYPGILTGG